MKRFALLFLLISLVFSSCSQDEVEPLQACDTQNVLVDLPWLAALINEQEQSFIGQNYSFISSGKIKGRRVFILNNCCPYCSMTPPPVLDCSGNELGDVATSGFEIKEIDNYEVIWKSSKNSCAFPE